jgi:hypothetical protein
MDAKTARSEFFIEGNLTQATENFINLSLAESSFPE